jgi:2-octaprenyl-6-methoxyphenol hydroxylase
VSSSKIAIAGGGAAGLALALALQKHGLSTEIFDAAAPGAGLADKRILALSHGSVQTLEWLGVWSGLQGKSAPITTIHISQQGGLGRTRISAAEQQVPALGYVCPAAELIAALVAAAEKKKIPLHHQRLVHEAVATNDGIRFQAGDEEHHAALLAYAEGAIDEGQHLRQRDYGQHAITCTATLAQPHKGNAWERFTAHGPVALLPVVGNGHSGKDVAVVYTGPSGEAAVLQGLDDAAFITRLQAEFNGRLQITSVSHRYRFPLGLRYRDTTIGQRQVWLGNAAQTLHPVAGQGYNLALRDIRDLARTLADCAREDTAPGSAEVLQRYAASRRLDRRSTIGFTDGLVRLFSNDHPLLHHARGAGLLALDLLPPLRNFVANRMMFGARAFP